MEFTLKVVGMGYFGPPLNSFRNKTVLFRFSNRPGLSSYPANDQAHPIQLHHPRCRMAVHTSLTSELADRLIKHPYSTSFWLGQDVGKSLLVNYSDDGRPTFPTLHSSSLTPQRTCDDYRVSLLSTGEVASRYPRRPSSLHGSSGNSDAGPVSLATRTEELSYCPFGPRSRRL